MEIDSDALVPKEPKRVKKDPVIQRGAKRKRGVTVYLGIAYGRRDLPVPENVKSVTNDPIGKEWVS